MRYMKKGFGNFRTGNEIRNIAMRALFFCTFVVCRIGNGLFCLVQALRRNTGEATNLFCLVQTIRSVPHADNTLRASQGFFILFC